jgi:hypothetical protein
MSHETANPGLTHVMLLRSAWKMEHTTKLALAPGLEQV